MQVQGAQKGLIESVSISYKNPIQATLHMIKHEGCSSFWQGIGAVVGGAPFASGLYFGGVELTKQIFKSGKSNNALIDFSAGVIGQLSGSIAWVPMDVLKERLQIQGQVQSNAAYSSSAHALGSIIRSEGVLGLYRAYFIHQFTWAPFNGLYWMTYEKSKAYLKEQNDKMANTTNFIVSSCIAGTVSSIATSPLDLVKTRMQVQKANPELFAFNNSFQCALRVFKTEGVLAFFDGVIARCCWLTPRYVIAVSLFDGLKDRMIVSNEGDGSLVQLDATT